MPSVPGFVKVLFLFLQFIILLLAFPVYDFYSWSGKASRWAMVALIALSAGIAGNLIDDIFLPYTTDFMQVLNSPSANLADLLAYAGICALAIELVVLWRKSKKHRSMIRHAVKAGQIRRDFITFIKSYFTGR